MRILRGVSVGLFMLVLMVASDAQQKPLSAEQEKVVDTIKAIFVAAKADDTAKFDEIVVPGYYMFDNGVRFDGDAIMKLLAADHAEGVRYDWDVTDPDVHIDGNSAWVAYVNRGSITDAKGKVSKMSWLESAFLEKQNGAWKILFFHSTRTAAQTRAEGGH